MIVTTDNFIFLLSKLAGEHVIHQRGRSSTIACIYVIASDRVFHCVQVEISKVTRLGFTTRASTWASSHVSRSLYYSPLPSFDIHSALIVILIMLLPQIIACTLVLAPSLASAAIFPKDSQVKMIDAKGFKKAMKQNVSPCHTMIKSNKTILDRKQAWLHL